MQQGLRSVIKYLVSFNPESRIELIKAFNKSGFLKFIEVEEGFLVEPNADPYLLSTIKGVESVDRVGVIERKEYTPSLVPTGILINNLPWHTVSGTSLNVSYSLAPKLVVSRNEVFVSVISIADYTIIRQGEELGEVMLIAPGKQINLTKQDPQVGVM